MPRRDRLGLPNKKQTTQLVFVSKHLEISKNSSIPPFLCFFLSCKRYQNHYQYRNPCPKQIDIAIDF